MKIMFEVKEIFEMEKRKEILMIKKKMVVVEGV